MHTKAFIAAIAIAIAAPVALSGPAEAKSLAVAVDDAPKVQVAILLDTSSSMSGLINQAKSELWSVVNRLSEARHGKRGATIEVALFEYGKSSIARGEGYVRMISPLTTDLDRISEELFALTTNGGDEWAGVVISKATESLTWSPKASDYKVIFIAGNEPFSQGPLPYQEAISTAVARGIVVNTIHCGDERDGLRGKWADGAALGGGRYLAINHNAVRLHVATPYDKKIADLNTKLNRTYIAYGRGGEKKAARQRRQDANARSMGAGIAAQRAMTKSGRAYKNSSWDLVDGMKDGKANLESLDDEALPAEMRSMTKKQRKGYVAKKSKERARIKASISALSKKRTAFIAKKRAKNTREKTLDKAMIETVDSQMKARGYRFK